MSPAFSVYLDLVRFVAALAVFLHHLASPTFTDGVLPERLGNYGPAAVTLFFVLSGYVIAHVVASRENSWTHYSASRLARMYSVLLVALVVTLASDQLGQHLAGAFYRLPKALNKPESATSYAAVLGFVNEYRVFHWQGITAGTNSVLWSLSFEATY